MMMMMSSGSLPLKQRLKIILLQIYFLEVQSQEVGQSPIYPMHTLSYYYYY